MIAITLAIVSPLHRRYARIAQRRRQLIERYPDWADDLVAAALAQQWKRPAIPPDARAVLNAVRVAPPPQPPRARIVCIGLVDVPEVKDLRFEPIIITPTRFIGKRLWLAAAAMAILGLWIAQELRLVPGLRGLNIGSFAYFVFMGFLAGGAWVWRTMIRPTYVRLAPGMVQIVQFTWGQGKPTIRSYPMTPGTVVVVQTRAVADKPTVVTIARGENLDDIPLWQMPGRDDATERLWQALLSTAPTPPLSDEDLVG